MAKAKAGKPATEKISEEMKPAAKALKAVGRAQKVSGTVSGATVAALAAPVELPEAQMPAGQEATPPSEAPKPAAEAPKTEVKPEPEGKVRKPKLVRDSFTMPESEYAVLGDLKKSCLKAGIEVKKSELLRAGVALLKRLDTAAIAEVLATLPSLKAGRPKKGK